MAWAREDKFTSAQLSSARVSSGQLSSGEERHLQLAVKLGELERVGLRDVLVENEREDRARREDSRVAEHEDAVVQRDRPEIEQR